MDNHHGNPRRPTTTGSGNDIETMSTKEAQEMNAKDPKKVVYEYQFDTVDRIKPAKEVADLIHLTLQKRNELLESIDDGSEKTQQQRKNDDEIRNYLASHFPALEDFQNTHPSIFVRITSSKFSPKEMQLLQFQLNLRAMVETGQISPNQAGELVQLHTVKQFQTGESYEAYKKRTAKEEKKP